MWAPAWVHCITHCGPLHRSLPPPVWLCFNYTHKLDLPRARTINLSELQGENNFFTFDCKLANWIKINNFFFLWSPPPRPQKYSNRDKRLKCSGWHLLSGWDKCVCCADVCTTVYNLLGDSLITLLRAYVNGASHFIWVSMCVSNDKESLRVGSVQCAMLVSAEQEWVFYRLTIYLSISLALSLSLIPLLTQADLTQLQTLGELYCL